LGLAEAGLSVVILDAKDIGWGASGRSGGQCNPIWRATPQDLAQRLGDKRATQLVDTTIGSATALFDDINRYKIDCDAIQKGWVQAAHSKKAARFLSSLQSAWAASGARITTLEGSDVERISGSPAYSFALLHETGGHVHPLSLTRGYAAAAVERGTQIYCGEPVTILQRNKNHWQVQTPSGSVSANQVVITTNAYTGSALWPGLQQTFLPMVSVSLATAPLSAELRATVLPGNVTLADSRLAIYYCRYDRDGRLIFGCVGSADSSRVLGGVERLRSGLHTVFPQLRQIDIECTWAGRIAVTPEMMPHIHEPAPGIIAGIGFSGRGIAMTSVMGRALAKRILGEPEHTLPFPVQPVNKMALHSAKKTLIPLMAPAMSLKDRLDTMIDKQ